MKKILSVFIALSILITCFNLSVVFASANENQSTSANMIKGATLRIGESLSIDYYAVFEADPSLVKMVFTKENGEQVIAEGEYVQEYEAYRFTYAVNPQCMTDTIKAELVLNDGTVLATKEQYSVKEYCDSMVTKTSQDLNGQVKNVYILRRLLADTLIYGKYAQLRMDYKTSTLADSSSWVNDYASTFAMPTGVKKITGNEDKQNAVKSASLNMSEYNRIYFRLILTDETVKVTLNDVEVSREELQLQEDGTYVVYTPNLKATDFSKVYTLKLIKGDEIISKVDYNINAYIESKYSNATVGDIAQSLNNYGASAVAYRDMLNGAYDDDYDLDEEESFMLNLLPQKSSNFNSATTFASTGWNSTAYNNGNIVSTGIADDNNGGNCVYYERTPNTSINFDTICFNIAPYITKGGDYRINFKFKAEGAQGNSPFLGILRTSYRQNNQAPGKTSFVNNEGYCNLGEVEYAPDDSTWVNFSTILHVEESDIGFGGNWFIGVHSLVGTVTKVYFDDVELYYLDTPVNAKHVTNAQTWVANEAVFVSSKTYADPYRDVTMDLMLTNGHVTYPVPCFWDGGNVWRARFVCTSAGDWTYTTECSDTTNTGLHQQESGVINCAQYTGDLDIYTHGFVRTQENTKYFTYADGTPFFYLGDTHWNLGRESLGMVKAVADFRADQGFTVFQSQPNGAAFDFTDGISANDIPRFETFDKKFKYIAEKGFVHANAQFFYPSSMDDFIEYFGKKYNTDSVDIVYNGEVLQTVYGVDSTKPYAEQENMHYGYLNANNVLQHEYIPVTLYDFAKEVKNELELASRYWVARYSAYPVMWTLGQEVDNDFMFGDEASTAGVGFGHAVWGKANNPYKLVAQYINKHDPYKSPLTAHQESATRFLEDDSLYGRNGDYNEVFGKETAHTWYGAQWKVKFDATSLKDVHKVPKLYWENNSKVVVNYESYYDMLQTEEFGARAQGWMAYLSGIYGYGWGGQGTWQYLGNYYSNSGTIKDGVDEITLSERTEYNNWTKYKDYASAEQLGIMHNFFENTVEDWHTLIPRFDDTNYLTLDDGAIAIMASKDDKSKAVIYFMNFSDETVADDPNALTKIFSMVISDKGDRTGTVKNLEGDTQYKYIWLNPITGEKSVESTFTSTSAGEWDIPEKAKTDMVLYIYQ